MYGEMWDKLLDAARGQARLKPGRGSSARFSFANIVELSANTCMIFFFLSGSLLRNVVPDYEMNKCKIIFNEMIIKGKCHESHFGLGKLL